MRNTQLTDQCLTKLPKLVDLVLEEHEHQIDKWGVQTHTPWEWLGYTLEELGELSAAISDYEYGDGLIGDGVISDVVREAIQAATLCLKIVEMYMDLENQDA